MDKITFTPPVIASYIIAAISALLVLKTGLLWALFPGLFIYALVHVLASRVKKRVNFFKARIVILAFLSLCIVGGISAFIFAVTVLVIQNDAVNAQVLMEGLADFINQSRHKVPFWLEARLPHSGAELHHLMLNWLGEQGEIAKRWGESISRSLLHLLMGMVIGGLVAIYDIGRPLPTFMRALVLRCAHLQLAFKRIVFAQARISAFNTVLSGAYLLIVLPIMGIHLPFAKTMVLITFITGLLPVIGNILSNTVIVTVSLSYSIEIALLSLLYLVVIHKLEYFLNAKIIGIEIKAAAWELLIAMLVMEAIFGISGLIAAPVFYAWLKIELGVGHR